MMLYLQQNLNLSSDIIYDVILVGESKFNK